MNNELEDKIIERFNKKTLEYLGAFDDDQYFALKIYALLMSAKEIAQQKEHGIELLEEAFSEVMNG